MNRFHAAGMWTNPFDSVVPALVGYQSPPGLCGCIEAEVPLLVIRGASGHGKSTALAFVAHQLRRQGRDPRLVYVAAGRPRPDLTPEPGGALLVDEANRLWPWEVARLARGASRARCVLVLATHRPDDGWLRAAYGARSVVLSRWRDPAILPAIFEARAQYVQSSAGACRPEPAIWPAALIEGGGNPHRVLRFLYWLVEVCADPRHPVLVDVPSARAAFRQFEPPAPSPRERLADWLPG